MANVEDACDKHIFNTYVSEVQNDWQLYYLDPLG